MPIDYKLCRNGSCGPRTMADAVEVLVASANFNEYDLAKILSGPLRLPSGKIVWQVLVVFEGADCTEGRAVPFRATEQFSAFEHNKAAKTKFEVEALDGATVDFSGAVTLPDGRRLRSIEIIPAQMPYDLSKLDVKIIHLTLSMIDGAESRCYRDIRDSLPESERDALPSRRLLDFSQLTEGPGRPALAVPLLKQIRAKFGDTYPTSDLPSEQKISDALEKAGKRRILETAAQPGASVSEVARRYGIDRRILCRWKQELTPPAFITVEVTDVAVNIERPAP